jgi:predicted aspartyl protease
MGRLYAELTLSNFNDARQTLTVTALVDTGADYITLPAAWMESLGELRRTEVLATMADGSAQRAWMCAGVEAQVADFRPFFAEVLFLEMEPNEQGEYEPLIGHIALEQSGAAVDMGTQRLVRIPYVYVK